MRAFLAVLLLSSTAYADRSGVWSAGATGAARSTGADFGSASNPSAVFGARVSLAFEEPPIPMMAGDWWSSDTSLVPELLAGFLADDTRAEGYIGAGARLDFRITSNRHEANQRTTPYVAARAIIIGKHQDSATEIALGGHISHGADRRRFGWELAVMLRPQNRDQQHEVNTMLSLYTSWR
jgi:hypothetical protein